MRECVVLNVILVCREREAVRERETETHTEPVREKVDTLILVCRSPFSQ